MSDLSRYHNQPPLLERLAADYAALSGCIDAIAARANGAPRKITTDADLDVVGAIVVDASALVRKAEAHRKDEKDEFLRSGRDVDAFFKNFIDRIDRIKQAFQAIADIYQREKVAEARRLAEEVARKARDEEERQREIARRADEANRAKTADKHGAKADEAAAIADEAEALAASSAADLTRTRTASGTLATAKTEWAFEITDYEVVPLDKLRPYLKRDAVESAIRALVKVHQDKSPMTGVRIFQDIKASFR